MPVSFVFEDGGFELDTKGMRDLLISDDGEVMSDLKRRGRLILMASKRQVGVDTGELKESGHLETHRRWGNPEVWVEYDNEIALLHHEGTRPHAIEARGPKMLRYSSRGRIAYARRVEHPGTEPNRYLSDNLYLAGG